MKKLLLLGLVVFPMISCSNETDSTIVDSDKDPLIGVWKLLKVASTEVNDCKKKTTYTFKSDFTFTFKGYKSVDGTCTEKESKKGEWKNRGNNVYYIKEHGFTSGTEITFTFSENNTVFKFGNLVYKK